MRKYVIVFITLFSCSCNTSVKKSKISIVTTKTNHNAASIKKNQSSAANKNKILGIWTDGSTENATFDINKDSIYYVDQFKSYKYLLKRDSIKIYYSDFVYKATFDFKNDTLIMKSHDAGVSKFWKFKH